MILNYLDKAEEKILPKQNDWELTGKDWIY
jgi:hypothetical protein